MSLLIIHKLIKSVVKELSRKDKTKFDFQIIENGNNFSFSFKSFLFGDIEESYNVEKRKSNVLQQAFEILAKEQVENINNIPSFFRFYK